MTKLISHTIRIRIPRAQQVSLMGDFNNWHTQSHPLLQVAPGLWECAVSLPAGKHRYAFHVVEDLRKTGGVWRTRVAGEGAVLWVPEDPEEAVSITSYPAQVGARERRETVLLSA